MNNISVHKLVKTNWVTDYSVLNTNSVFVLIFGAATV